MVSTNSQWGTPSNPWACLVKHCKRPGASHAAADEVVDDEGLLLVDASGTL